MSAATTYDEGLAALRAKYDAKFFELAKQQAAEKLRLDDVFMPEVKIIGLTCRALTLADELSLRRLNNPMFAGVNDKNKDVPHWAMCVHYIEHQMQWTPVKYFTVSRQRRQLAQFRLQLERLRKLAPKFEDALVGEVLTYLASLHTEKMTSGQPGKNGLAMPVSPVTSIIHRFAKAYGWTADYVVQLPVGFVNQLLLYLSVEAAAEAGEKPRFANEEKGRLTAGFLDELNILNRSQ